MSSSSSASASMPLFPGRRVLDEGRRGRPRRRRTPRAGREGEGGLRARGSCERSAAPTPRSTGSGCPAFSAAIGEHRQDADRTLVGAALEFQKARTAVLSLLGEDRDRARVRHVGEHRAEEDDAGDPAASSGVDDLAAEGLPAARRLGAEQHVDAVAVRAGPERVTLGHSSTRSPSSSSRRRPVELVVEVVLGLDFERRARGRAGRARRARLRSPPPRRRSSLRTRR